MFVKSLNVQKIEEILFLNLLNMSLLENGFKVLIIF